MVQTIRVPVENANQFFKYLCINRDTIKLLYSTTEVSSKHNITEVYIVEFLKK